MVKLTLIINNIKKNMEVHNLAQHITVACSTATFKYHIHIEYNVIPSLYEVDAMNTAKKRFHGLRHGSW